jgi:GMP synthase-like glutamine amidotransferase
MLPRILLIKPYMEDRAEALEPAAAAAGVELVDAHARLGHQLPEVAGFDALVTLGGTEHPEEHSGEDSYLRGVEARMRQAVEKGLPVLGLCLGAQMLARAFGGRWYKGPTEEIGVREVELTDAAKGDPLFAGVPGRLSVIHYHRDTFDLPPGATLLARAREVPNQAFRIGEHGYGVQWHAECTAQQWPLWVDAGSEELIAAHGQGIIEKLKLEVRETEPLREAWRRRMFENFVAMLRR